MHAEKITEVDKVLQEQQEHEELEVNAPLYTREASDSYQVIYQFQSC